MNNLKNVLITIYHIWKPDFRKTTGWLLITSGFLLISPNFIQDIILNMLRMHDIYTSDSFDDSKVIGALLISAGIHYHLLFLTSKANNNKLEVVVSISLLLLLPVMIYLSI